MLTLAEAVIGKRYVIKKVFAKEPLRGRLVAMGFGLGCEVVVQAFTMAKQTLDVQVEDSFVALRREEASQIELEEMV